MKTIIISITGGATSSVLKFIRENAIAHTYLGIDQHDQLLLQLSYLKEQQDLINEIHQYLKSMEAFNKELNEVLEPIIKKIKDEEDLAFQTLKIRHEERKKARINKTAIQNGEAIIKKQ